MKFPKVCFAATEHITTWFPQMILAETVDKYCRVRNKAQKSATNSEVCADVGEKALNATNTSGIVKCM